MATQAVQNAQSQSALVRALCESHRGARKSAHDQNMVGTDRTAQRASRQQLRASETSDVATVHADYKIGELD